MISTSFGMLFYIKKHRKGANGECPIFLRITVDKVPREITTHRTSDPAYWNQDKGRIIIKRSQSLEEGRALNAYLDTLQAKVFEAKHILIESRKPVS